VRVDRLLPQTATVTTVQRTGDDDVFGDPGETTSTRSWRCWISQSSRDEDTGGGDRQDETFTIYMEPTAKVAGSDRVTVNDATFEVIGPPWTATNPRTGIDEMVVATIKRTV
jgi:hypothetical protein